MNIYALGDLHISFDERVHKPMDIFGDIWKDHFITIEKHWREIVKEEDLVIIPGDVSWALRPDEVIADLDWIHKLPGKKVITKGNHDLWWTSITKLNKLYDDITFLQNHAYITEDGIAICGTRGWICPGTEGFDDHDQKIYDRELLRLRFSLEEGQKSGAKEIIGSIHYPPTNDKHQPSGFTELFREFGVKTCVYGHLHGHEAFKHGIKGVLDGTEYKLVSYDYLEGIPELIVKGNKE